MAFALNNLHRLIFHQTNHQQQHICCRWLFWQVGSKHWNNDERRGQCWKINLIWSHSILEFWSAYDIFSWSSLICTILKVEFWIGRNLVVIRKATKEIMLLVRQNVWIIYVRRTELKKNVLSQLSLYFWNFGNVSFQVYPWYSYLI